MPINGASAQIIEIVDRQVFLEQEIINRYWYRLNSLANVSAVNVATQFQSVVIDSVVDCQQQELTHIDITVINHSDDSVFGTFGSGTNGSLTAGDLAPPFSAIGVRLNRTTRDMRNGQKRIGGLSDGNQSNGLFLSGFLATASVALAPLASNLIDGAQTFQPVVVRNKPTDNDLTIDPLDPTTWRYTLVGGVTIKNAVTTQNSRKF